MHIKYHYVSFNFCLFGPIFLLYSNPLVLRLRLNLFLWLLLEFETYAIHSHDNCNILDMVHMFDLLCLEIRQDLFDPCSQKLQTFLIRVSNYKAVYMH